MAYYDLSLQRKQEIENNLLALMQELPYDRISVKDLTNNMQIARKTFYHYFHNKQACLESLMDRMILDCNLAQLSLPENAVLKDVYRARLLFWMEKRGFLEAILRNHMGTLFAERALLYIRQEDLLIQSRLSTKALPCDDDVLFSYISGQVCLILKWCRDGFPRPLEEMIQVSMRLAQEPLLPRETV